MIGAPVRVDHDVGRDVGADRFDQDMHPRRSGLVPDLCRSPERFKLVLGDRRDDQAFR